MSEEDTANQVIEEDLITLEGEQTGIDFHTIDYSESSYISGGGNSKTIETQTRDDQEENIENNQETTRGEYEDTESDATNSDQEEEHSNHNTADQEDIEPYDIYSDQESDSGRLFINNTSSSEEPSPEKKDKKKEIISSGPAEIEQENSNEENETQIPSPTTDSNKMSTMTTLDVSQTTDGWSNMISGISAMTPSVPTGLTGEFSFGNIGNQLGMGKYECWVKGCKNQVDQESKKCADCSNCYTAECN